MTTTEQLFTDTATRLVWEDEPFAAYQALGYDVDDALTLVTFDYALATGEDFYSL
jgi:hypothetical protein